MPNYVKNILSFDGDPAQVSRLLAAIQGENGPMDFNKLIPMPSKLEIESGSRTTVGFKEYMGFLGETGCHTELEDNYLAAHPEINREEWELGNQAYQNIQKYGCPTWYEWRGTKWNASNAEIAERQLSFLTAWNAPKPILEKLSQMFPSITIHHVWADEDIGHNCGERKSWTLAPGDVLLFEPDPPDRVVITRMEVYEPEEVEEPDLTGDIFTEAFRRLPLSQQYRLLASLLADFHLQ